MVHFNSEFNSICSLNLIAINPFHNFAAIFSDLLFKTMMFPMKNKLLALFVSLNLLAGTSVLAQDVDKIAKDIKTGNDILLGAVTREGLKNIGTWFTEEYDLYSPDTAAISYLIRNKEKLPNVFVVLGTWCGDSKEHVPHFYKIMDLIDYPAAKIFMVSVDRDKKAEEFCLADFEITLVPTFIFTSKGEEIGRIIETPAESLEKDLVNIMKQK